ncbi:hypothetical protein FRB96_004478 [Tulasnella sp. 330]|nr:hypothetical protein FRB96_004478 [Tulasnella sp. 330]KAG8871102.1 hypothetical protein FRB98_001034 [Tulasnella sp. 332]
MRLLDPRMLLLTAAVASPVLAAPANIKHRQRDIGGDKDVSSSTPDQPSSLQPDTPTRLSPRSLEDGHPSSARLAKRLVAFTTPVTKAEAEAIEAGLHNAIEKHHGPVELGEVQHEVLRNNGIRTTAQFKKLLQGDASTSDTFVEVRHRAPKPIFGFKVPGLKYETIKKPHKTVPSSIQEEIVRNPYRAVEREPPPGGWNIPENGQDPAHSA